MHQLSRHRQSVVLAVALAVVTFLVFRGVLNHDFVNYDDPDYVTANSALKAGFSADSLRWAFTTGHAGNWHPLTWLTHLLDVQLYGLTPAGHHLTNLLFHCANAVLLFLLVQKLTGGLWRSALVAALFALHPLRVESVAWISERKDVLSGFFFLLTLLAYASYALRHSLRDRSPPAAAQRNYALALFCFALGLMSKPMLVTLPFVLVLLDFWPLQRAVLTRDSFWKSLREKIPFFALAAASSVVTFLVQQRGGAMTSTAALGDRLANALIAYARYLGKSFWPDRLAVFYPYPASWPAELLLGALLLLAAISWFAIRGLKSRPALVVGWLWFVGMLVPAIGIVQVGGQSMADRYTYLPHIGLFLALLFAWPVPAHLAPGLRSVIVSLAAIVLIALGWQTTRQVAYWRDSETLFRHAIAVTERNEVAHNNLGVALQKRGAWAAAAEQHAAAIAVKSRYADAEMNLGNCLLRLGDFTNALPHLQRAVELEPSARAYYNLGTAHLENHRHAEAREQLRRAVSLDPAMAEAQLNLGMMECALGDASAGVRACRAALALRPDWPAAWLQLGNALGQQKDFAAAAEAFAQAAKLSERDTTALFNLANSYVELGKLREAIATLEQLLVMNPPDLEARRLLATTRLRAGDAAGAVSQLEQIVRLEPGVMNQFALAQGLLAAGRRNEAIATYREVLKLQPELPAALNDLAWLLATNPDAATRKGIEAVTCAEKACTLTQRKNPLLLGTLAAAYAEAGRFPDAVKTAEEAIALAKSAGLAAIVARNEELLNLYRAGRAYHESGD